MVVATGALERESEHRRAEGVIPIGDVLNAKLFRHTAALDLLRMQPVERGGQPLVVGRVGQQVAGELPREKIVVRQVVVERADHPVAPGPDVAVAIDLIAVGVRVPREVEPVHREVFAEARMPKQPVDDFLVGVGRVVIHEPVNLGQRRRQPGEIKRQPTNQFFAIGLG